MLRGLVIIHNNFSFKYNTVLNVNNFLKDKLPKNDGVSWICNRCPGSKEFGSTRESHDYHYHDVKTRAFICPCGFGCLVTGQLFKHMVNKHGWGSMDSRPEYMTKYWWVDLPPFISLYFCHQCKLTTPLADVEANHNHARFIPRPEENEWLKNIPPTFKPHRPLKDITVSAIEGALQDLNVSEVSHQRSGRSGVKPPRTSSSTSTVSKKKEAGTSRPKSDVTKRKEKNTAKKGEESQESETRLVILDDEKPDVYPVLLLELQNHPIPIPAKKSEYDSYRKYTQVNGQQMLMKGFIYGPMIHAPQIVFMKEYPDCGPYIIINAAGRWMSNAVVTLHGANQMGDLSEISQYFGYNPCNYYFAADLCYMKTMPFMITHHLTLSRIPEPGEYRMVREQKKGQFKRSVIWICSGSYDAANPNISTSSSKRASDVEARDC